MYSDALLSLPPLSSGYVPADGTRVKLNQNESPFDLDPDQRGLLLAELRAVALNRYPDPRHPALMALIAQTAGVPPDMTLVGNGANELIELLIRATCNPGDEVLTVGPTYHLYDRFVAMNRARLVKVGWGQPFGFPRDELVRAAGSRTRMILLCRPNNPTGHLFAADDVLALADGFPGMVVVDEAYYDFCRDTLSPWVEEAQNLVVVRTLSKAYGAAGLRLGFGLASPQTARAVRSLQLPYGINAYSEVVAGFLLARPWLMEIQRRAVLENREALARSLADIPGISVFPSAANFLLVRTGFSADAADRYLQARGIFVRNLKWDDRHLRISVATPGDHARLREALTAFADQAG